ncbi:stealth conserved region 3 domain-containing protein [Vibrio lentus]|uniref:stealth conserved region 3 domain-containing protein n=1 Tax=Vibrio lentus TaxID=136468 RepID=UPI000C8342D0|nr:stealth conserved region 3 domain-containing protein [Vibrio lentus]
MAQWLLSHIFLKSSSFMQYVVRKLRAMALSILKNIRLSWFSFIVDGFTSIRNKIYCKADDTNLKKVESKFAIDIVYTWVNSNDENWKNNKARFAGIKHNLPQESDVASRFRENDELRYSLRSVLANASWVRKIYIVTDDQKPDWFHEFDDRVQLVSHRDIFVNQDDLPCFNSHAIESNLHRIPGLSEHFLYFNDDVFLRSPVKPSDFFIPDGSQTKFFWSNQAFVPESIDTNSLPVDIAAVNNVNFLKENYGYTSNRKFKHTPIALKKSVIVELEREHPEIFIGNSSARFRSNTDYSILSALIHHYGVVKGYSVEGELPYLYASFSDELFEFKMNLLLLLKFKSFCINDVEVDEKRFAYISKVFTKKMKLLFPNPSPYEIDEKNEKNQ